MAVAPADSAVFYRSGGPGRPFRGRHAVFAPPDRKITAYSRARSPSLRAARRFWGKFSTRGPNNNMAVRSRRGGRRQATGARTGKKHLRNRHLSMVLEVKVSAVVPPARGPLPAAGRLTAPSAYPTQSGRPAFHTYRPTPSGECGIGSPTTAIFTANSVNN